MDDREGSVGDMNRQVPRHRQRNGKNPTENSVELTKDVQTTQTAVRADKPCHKLSDSLFSSRSGFHNYRGLLNDCIILLVLSNSKNVVTNLYKYGVRVNPLTWGLFFFNPEAMTSWGVFWLSWLFPLTILKCEQLAVKGYLSSKTLLFLHCLMLFLILTFPVGVSLVWETGVVDRFLVLFWHTIIWLKMVSYIQVNMWCREDYLLRKKGDQKKQEDNLVQYPDNLYLKDMLYFCIVPTLCYELNFPRNPRIRKTFLIRRILETVFLFNFVLAICQQWLMPIVLNSIEPFKQMAYTRIVERVFLLAVPNHIMWLIGFYCIFHSMMNMSAELLRFGDREFYKDWWNSDTIRRFWSTWNIPVHRWASRHVFSPLIKAGCSKQLAVVCVFAISAFFHEYMVSVPLRMLRMWAFVGMISQLPLGFITSFPLTRGQVGNVIVWTSIVLGQPLAILMYLHDYYWLNWATMPEGTTTTAATQNITMGGGMHL